MVVLFNLMVKKRLSDSRKEVSFPTLNPTLIEICLCNFSWITFT